jgi:hypothetical protein
MEQPLHLLALIIGIVFASLAPDLFTGKPGSIEQEHVDTPEKTQRFLNTLPWETRPKGGLKRSQLLLGRPLDAKPRCRVNEQNAREQYAVCE